MRSHFTAWIMHIRNPSLRGWVGIGTFFAQASTGGLSSVALAALDRGRTRAVEIELGSALWFLVVVCPSSGHGAAAASKPLAMRN